MGVLNIDGNCFVMWFTGRNQADFKKISNGLKNDQRIKN